MNYVNLGDILPREAVKLIAREMIKVKKGQIKGSIKQHFATLLAPHKDYMADRGADLDYICYVLEYAVQNKL